MMAKGKKGDLQGRVVGPYIRRKAKKPDEYENVLGYQERRQPTPSPLAVAAIQSQFDFSKSISEMPDEEKL